MIDFLFDAEGEGLEKSAQIIISRLGIDADLNITVKKSGRLFLSCNENKGRIEYATQASFFRMLTIFWREYKKKKSFTYEEEIYFDRCGPMLDMSRNAVLKVEKIKEYIEYLAMMGLNRLVLYLEDTYELERYPYFGYMRGRYTKEELKEIDSYASGFGIEVFPAIQTLGHMERYMHWDEAFPVRDTMHCLLAGEQKTYELIENMMKNVSECFSCNKIHIGMDEAHDFGLGQYLKKHGYEDRINLMINHLNRVNSIAKKYGLSISLWSDMFFRLLFGRYNADEIMEIDQGLKAMIPEDVTLVYWSYNEEHSEKYNKMFQIHNKISDKIAFAGGVESYLGFTCDTLNTFRIAQTALTCCKENNIKDIYATVWMDDGAESDFFMSLPSVQLFAENMYNKSDCEVKAKENYEFISGAIFEAFIDMSQFHNIFDGRKYEYWWLRYNGKKFIYQDILSGLCDELLIQNPMSGHYQYYAKKMLEYIDETCDWNEYYIYAKVLFDAVAIKCEIAENLRKAYIENDRQYLEFVCDFKLDELYEKMSLLKKTRMDMWYKNNKPFGGEVIDVRLTGVLGRIVTAKERIILYIEGKINTIEELEAERLPFTTYYSKDYAKIVTAGIM